MKKYVPALCAICGILIKRKATGLGYYTQHFIHLFRDSDRSRTSTSPGYQKDLVVSGLYENGFGVSAKTFGTALRNRGIVLGSGSWSRAHWHLILIGKMPGILSLKRRCTDRRCGHDPCSVERGVSSYRISSYLQPPKQIFRWPLVRCICGAYGRMRGPTYIPPDFSSQRNHS